MSNKPIDLDLVGKLKEAKYTRKLTSNDLLKCDPNDLIEPRNHPILKKVSRPTLYRFLLAGKIVSILIGQKWLTTTDCIEDFLKECSQTHGKKAIAADERQEVLAKREREVVAAEAKFASRRTCKK